ncbi:hypothetical protein HHX47_DHR1000245 [Lentinula edodes]|nr:hypothetical protein HHX47_DHR1000245 [Lentinula edodes]
MSTHPPRQCYCRKYCGGPNRPGIRRPYSTYNRHTNIEKQTTQSLHEQVHRLDGTPIPSSSTLSQPLELHNNQSPGSITTDGTAGEEDLERHDSGQRDDGEVGINITDEPISHILGEQTSSFTHIVTPVSPNEDFDFGSMAHLRHEEEEEARQARTASNLCNQDQLPSDEYPDTENLNFVPQIEDISIALKFVNLMKEATLDSSIEPLPPDILEQLSHPPEQILSIENPDHCLSLDIFLALTDALQESYNQVRQAVIRRYPRSELLTYHQVKKLVEWLSGVSPISWDMCVNSCIGYTGPFAELMNCPYCGEDWYVIKKGKQDGFIPGPHKPKNIDSFLFPGLYHLSAIQRQGGICMWDALDDAIIDLNLFLAIVSADTPAMACLTGFVGHQARLKPNGYNVVGSNHPDIDIDNLLLNFNSKLASQRYHSNLRHVVTSPNKTQYTACRLETGIVKPTIFSGLSRSHILGIPAIFTGDCMHLPALNVPDLYLSLWRGTIDCDRKDDKNTWDWAVFRTLSIWKEHGKEVAAIRPYIPGSFDRPPRDPAEKLNSGYKA